MDNWKEIVIVALCTLQLFYQIVESTPTAAGYTSYPLPEGGSRKCKPRDEKNSCPPDHEMEVCTEELGESLCVPCPHSKRNCQRVYDGISDMKCINPMLMCKPDQVVVPGVCPIKCVCDPRKGVVQSGDECDQIDACPVNQTLVLGGSVCTACPLGTYKPQPGFHECISVIGVLASISPISNDLSLLPANITDTSLSEPKPETTTNKPIVDAAHNSSGYLSMGQIVGIVLGIAAIIPVGFLVHYTTVWLSVYYITKGFCSTDHSKTAKARESSQSGRVPYHPVPPTEPPEEGNHPDPHSNEVDNDDTSGNNETTFVVSNSTIPSKPSCEVSGKKSLSWPNLMTNGSSLCSPNSQRLRGNSKEELLEAHPELDSTRNELYRHYSGYTIKPNKESDNQGLETILNDPISLKKCGDLSVTSIYDDSN